MATLDAINSLKAEMSKSIIGQENLHVGSFKTSKKSIKKVHGLNPVS